MGLKIAIPIEYQRVKKISLTAMPFRGVGGPVFICLYNQKLLSGTLVSEAG